MSGPTPNLSNHSCIIEVKPRIHITLIGLDEGRYRTNGGVGFSIGAPTATVSVSQSTHMGVVDERLEGFTKNELAKIEQRVNEIRPPQAPCANIVLSGDMPSHKGLGSGTAIRLACLEACNQMWNISSSEQTTVQHSGRGGTSGIGVRTYFKGGFVFDMGVRGSFRPKPSSEIENRSSLPLLLLQHELPNWEIGLCVPKNLQGLSGEKEAEFFANTCPLPKHAVNEVLYLALYGLSAALLEKDYNIWCDAIKRIQTTEWKYAERNVYSTALVDLENCIYTHGADCVGLSSIGPCLYYFGKDVATVTQSLQRSREDCLWIHTNLNNAGRILHV